MEVGPTEEGYWATGNIEWSFIKSKKVNPELIRVEMIDSNPYFPELS
jgi:hypothetical protein